MSGCLFFPLAMVLMLGGVALFGVSANSVSSTPPTIEEVQEPVAVEGVTAIGELGIEVDGVMVYYALTPHGEFDAFVMPDDTTEIAVAVLSDTPLQATARTEDGTWVLFGYYNFENDEWRLAWGLSTNFELDETALMALQVVDPNSAVMPGPIPLE